MSWLLPSVFAIGGIAVLATLALHFIARSRPLAEPLPTARFVPQQPVHARARSMALSDLILLVLRAAAIMLIAAGAAGPVLGSRGRVVRVIAADRSRDVAALQEVKDSVRAYSRAGDELVVFDSESVRSPSVDSISTTSARGSLSVAMAAAIHASARAAAQVDSIEIVLIAPFSRDEMDDATLAIRDSWPGRVRTVPVHAAALVNTPPRVEIVADENDAVAAGASLMGAVRPGSTVRVVRSVPSPADSAWSRVAGHVLVVWPAASSPPSWPQRRDVDTIGAVTSSTGTLVARFPRPWALSAPVTIARWADGAPAAVERVSGAGCIRDIGIVIDESSDVTLREPFRQFAGALFAPCGGARDATPVAADVMAAIAGHGPLAASAAIRDRATEISRATPWLLAAGALLLIVELAVRRTTRRLA